MTHDELKKLAARNLRNNPNPMIDTETGLRAVMIVAEIAERNRIDWALVGGIAMYIYGSPRLTKDVDVIASDLVPLQPERRIGFGGERYTVKVGKKLVPVDWIVRDDEAEKFYRNALTDAYLLPNGVPIVTPEWLVILKYIAGRFRDQEDGVFLLKQKKLVDRKSIRRKIIETAGGSFWALVASGIQRWYDLADGRIRTEKNDYEADRL